jgi:hypothetical protein
MTNFIIDIVSDPVCVWVRDTSSFCPFHLKALKLIPRLSVLHRQEAPRQGNFTLQNHISRRAQ